MYIHINSNITYSYQLNITVSRENENENERERETEGGEKRNRDRNRVIEKKRTAQNILSVVRLIFQVVLVHNIIVMNHRYQIKWRSYCQLQI